MIGICSVFVLAGTLAPLAGCSSGSESSRDWAASPAQKSGGVTIETKGKARDLSAAVSRSLPVVELAVLKERPVEGGGREFSLVGLQGEEGVLSVSYAEGTAQDLSWRRAVIDMRVAARIGLFGDEARERKLVEQVSKELHALARQE